MKKILTVFFFCYSSSVFCLPSGGHVVQGDATISHLSEAVHVNAKGKAIIHWDKFDIASHEAVSFLQSQSKNAVLNRVVSGPASQILGSLHANCPIYLINPQGVFIGSAAQITTAGFLATTANISNAAFWENSDLVFENFGSGKIVNLGTITSTEGDVFLIARAIDNPGQIIAPEGVVTLATSEVMINPETKQTIFIRLGNQNEEGIKSSGTIQALAVELKTRSPYEKAIQQTGHIEALATLEKNGHIYLVADQGGCLLDGTLASEAGNVQVIAKDVHVTEKSIIDVSSQQKGGTIQIADSTLSLRVDSGARLLANAHLQGDGGDINLSTEDQLIFQGFADVRGGVEGGNGGTLHLSCQGETFHLNENFIDAAAPKGIPGRFVFDPKFVTIVYNGAAPATGNTFGSNPTGSVRISGATLQSALNAANVTIQANTDIIFNDQVTASAVGNGLTLQAGRSIFLLGNLSLNGGEFKATINDAGASGAHRDPGVANFEMNNLSQVNTQGGAITVSVGIFGGKQEGEILVYSGVLNAGGGRISMEGFARQDGSDYASGLSIGGESQILTNGNGTVTLSGVGGTGAQSNIGVYISSQSTQLQTDAGLLHVIGYGGGNGSGNGNIGIYAGSSISSTSTGPITLEGFGGSGINENMGICLSRGEINTLDGDITLNGVGSGTGELNFGLKFEPAAQCSSTGTGAILLSGASGHGENNNDGIHISSGTVTAHNGSLTILGLGYGSDEYNYGIRLETDAQCISTGTAPITINGHNTGGLDENSGVCISATGNAITSTNGNIQVIGLSESTGAFNPGIRIEMGKVISTGTGPGAAQIYLQGTGGMGTDYCNGIFIEGTSSEVTSIDGNITVEGTARGSGQNNQPIVVDPATQVNTTGSGVITYIPH